MMTQFVSYPYHLRMRAIAQCRHKLGYKENEYRSNDSQCLRRRIEPAELTEELGKCNKPDDLLGEQKHRLPNIHHHAFCISSSSVVGRFLDGFLNLIKNKR